MIQFNLLPDVKLQFIKARRTQRLVIGGSLLVIALCAFVLVLLCGTVFVLQKKNLKDLNSDIASYTSKLKSTPDLNKVLTVQNQLKSLPQLHDQKPASTRMFGYVQQMVPSAASVSQLQVDFNQHTVTITGNANSLDVVNVFTDTLKFTTYKLAGQDTDAKQPNAFTNVVLSQFSRTSAATSYTITASFDPAIFDNRNDTSLMVPNIISTRSATEQPTDLFQSDSTANQGKQ